MPFAPPPLDSLEPEQFTPPALDTLEPDSDDGAGESFRPPSALSDDFIGRVKGLEGFEPRAMWDYKQHSVGYGTRGKPGEVIDRAEADKRLREELETHAGNVDRAAAEHGYSLTPRQREALVSFDFNTGSAGEVLKNSGGDLVNLRRRIGRYIHAGGEPLEGLRRRRLAELEWFDTDPEAEPALTRESVAAAHHQAEEKTLIDKADALAEGLGEGVRGIMQLGANAAEEVAAAPWQAAKRMPATIIEGLTRGTFDLADTARRVGRSDLAQAGRALTNPLTLLDEDVRSALLPRSEQAEIEREFQNKLQDQVWTQTRQAGLDGSGNLAPQLLGPPLPATSEALSTVLDPSLLLPGVGQTTKVANIARRGLGAAVAPAAHAVEVGSGAVSRGMLKAGEATIGAVERAGVDPTAVRAAAGAVGAGSLLTGPGQLAAGTLLGARAAETGAQALGAVAREAAAAPTQATIAERIMRDTAKPAWLRRAARASTVIPKAITRTGGAAVEGAAAGPVVGGLLAAASEEDAAGIGRGIGGGLLLGPAGAAIGANLPKARDVARTRAEDGDVLWALGRQAELGGEVDALAKLPRQELVKIATLQRLMADTHDVLFVGEKAFREMGGPPKQGGMMLGPEVAGRPRIVVNLDATSKPARVFYHELAHALWQQPGPARDAAHLLISELYAPAQLDVMGREYALRILQAETPLRPPALPVEPSRPISAGLAAELGQPLERPVAAPDDPRRITAEMIGAEFQRRTAESIAAGDPDGRAWIRDEVLAEHFARELSGKPWTLEQMRQGQPPGSDTGRWREKWLEAKAAVLAALGVPFDQTGRISAPTSELFRDNPLLDDPGIQKLIATQLRERNRWLAGLDRRDPSPETLGGAPLVPARGLKALAASPAIEWRPRADGTAETDFATRDAAGNVKLKPAKEIAQVERLRAEQAQMLVPKAQVPSESPQFGRKKIDGKTVIGGDTLPPQFDHLVHFGPETLAAARAMEAARAGGGTFDLWYHQIGTGSNGSWAQSVRRGLGNVAASQRELSLVGWELTKSGNLIAKSLDVGAARARAFELATNGQLDLWGGNVDAFHADVLAYLANHAAGRGGDTGIGIPKRECINGFFGVSTHANRAANPIYSGQLGRSLIKSFRLDRMQNVKPTGRQGWAVTYPRMKMNLSPGDGL